MELIQVLLNCPDGQESKVLQQNQSLLDKGLIQVMAQVIESLRQQGQKEQTNRLAQITIRLAQLLKTDGTSLPKSFIANYLREVLQVLSQPSDLRGMAQRVVLCRQALLLVFCQENKKLWAFFQNELGNSLAQSQQGDHAQNIEDAIKAYNRALQIWDRQTTPIDWAQSMNNLGNAYKDRIQGDRAQNIEDAIDTYKQVQQVITKQAMPIEWALFLMLNLADAYTKRIRGGRAQNIEKAINAYQQALQVITRRATPIEWATAMNSLANAYVDRTQGDLAQNIEVAIDIYQQALQVRKQETMPIQWADSMINLAIAYKKRTKGDLAENIETAISIYKKLPQIITREAMPVAWANLMNNLALAYSDRVRGERAENIEKAINIYRQSLQVQTSEPMSIERAKSVSNLGLAYSGRIRGNRAENIETAISSYRAALEVIKREILPLEWAKLMTNMAIAYSNRIKGDRIENLEEAISAYEQSLEVLTSKTVPVEWAQTMTNLALTYLSRVRGDRRENIEQAINACQQALSIRTRESMPIDWATSMDSLALAYSHRIQGNRAENIEEAIVAHQQALEVRTKESMPATWAQSMNNLALVYLDRIKGIRSENIEESILIYKQLLQIRTKESVPFEWAESMHNLALAYSARIDCDLTQNVEAIIYSFSQALEIFTPEAYPSHCRLTACLLANLYSDEERWSEAKASYKIAIIATEIVYQAALFKGSQEAELSEAHDLYRRAAYAYAKGGNPTKAIATLEQGRARGLSETLQRDRTDIETIRQIKPDLAERYQTAANAINQLESTERHSNTASKSPEYSQENFRQQAIQARQSIKNCLAEIRQISGYEKFLTLPTFDEIAAIAQPDHPLVYTLSTPNGSLALVLTTSDISPIWLDDLAEPKLLDFLKDNKFGAYRESQPNLQTWLEAIDNVTHQLWHWIMAPLISHLQQNNLSKAILIPTGYLSYLPLHAAWTPDTARSSDRRYACDDIQFTYIPNVLSLNAARTVAEQTPATTLLAINEPQPVTAGSLPSASAEAAKVISTFPEKGAWKLLQQENATRAAVLEQLPQKNVVHFACHGLANLSKPLDSGLVMANDEILSLRDLLDLNLQDLRLAILSACETGMSGTQLPDEVISLPTGLLQAGAAGVVSSLWSVADLSTMILLSRFYDLWRTENLEPPEALRQAQIWLRDNDKPNLVSYFENSQPAIAQKLAKLPSQNPFVHPFYWAAFTYVGV